jgi:hypothetical protein
MAKIKIHCEGKNLKASIEVDGVALPYVSKIILSMLPNSKTLLSVDRMACDENGKAIHLAGEFVYLTEHYSVDIGDMDLVGVKLMPKEDNEPPTY